MTDSNWEGPGEAVYTIGTPEGMAQTFTNGMFSGWLANGAAFRFTAPTGHGGSGGPIYGQVIGIVRSGFGEGGGRTMMECRGCHCGRSDETQLELLVPAK